MADIRQGAERRVAEMQSEYEKRLSGLLDLSEKLKGDVGEAQRQADKYRSAAQHLREQVRKAGNGNSSLRGGSCVWALENVRCVWGCACIFRMHLQEEEEA